MEIYIKPKRKAALLNKFEVLIGDVAEVIAAGDAAAGIEKIRLLEIAGAGAHKRAHSQNFLISVTDIIREIRAAYPAAVISNVGESDTWVHAVFREKAARPAFLWLRVAVVALVLFVGASTAIMSFHTDGQIPKIFEQYYEMLYGTKMKNPPIIAIPYAIGLATGILFFYNHFFGKKITDDPTPIEVEIQTYEKEVTEAMIDLMDEDNRDA